MLTQAASAAAGSPIKSPAGFTPSSTSQTIKNAENRILKAAASFFKRLTPGKLTFPGLHVNFCQRRSGKADGKSCWETARRC